MEYARQQFAGNFIQIRYHKQQALGCGKRGGQCAGGEGTVNGSGSSGLRLEFRYLYGLTENVFSSFGRPFIGVFGHSGRGGDRVDGGYVGGGVRYMGGCLIAVHCFFGSFHGERPPSIILFLFLRAMGQVFAANQLVVGLRILANAARYLIIIG